MWIYHESYLNRQVLYVWSYKLFSQAREMWDSSGVHNFGLRTLTIGRDEERKNTVIGWAVLTLLESTYLEPQHVMKYSMGWECYLISVGGLCCNQDKHSGWEGSCNFCSLHTLVIHSYSDSLRKIFLSSKHVPDKVLPLRWDWAIGVLNMDAYVSDIHIHSGLHSLRFSSTFYKKV